MPMLSARDLVVRYGSIEAVRGISFEVEEGEIVALLGTNGAGKTTTMHALAGLESVASGSVMLDGKEITGLEPEVTVRRGLALCPEGRRIFGRLTVEQNLRLGGIPLSGSGELGARMGYVRALFPRLEERSGQLAASLSGGEQQMLAIGRALMAKPRVLLMDEPSLGLAPIVVGEIFDLIRVLNGEGLTIVLVEQNAHLALEVSDRAYLMVNGRIEASGAAGDLQKQADLDSLFLGEKAPS